MHIDFKIKKISEWLDNNNGVYPTKSDNKEIYTYISYLRHRAKKGNLSNSHMQMLNSIQFEFNQRDQQWYLKFNKVREYTILHKGRLPRTGNKKKIKEYDSKTGEWTDENRKVEHYLGRWIMTQRALIKSRKIKEYRKELLESIDICIDGYQRRWDLRFYELYNYTLKENKIPHKNENHLHRNWFYHNLRLFDNNRLNDKQTALFTALISLLKDDFRPQESLSWDDRYAALKIFVNMNNRLPSTSTTVKINNPDEFSLGIWITCMKRQWRKNKLPIEKVLKLEKYGVVFKMIDHEKDWMEKFAIYCEFKTRFNREPRGGGKSGEEDQIAKWIYYNRSLYNGNYNNREIPQHRYDLLNSIDFPFINKYQKSNK